MNVLFVCTGNTCRSPMAAALANEMIPSVTVKSAGVFAGAGSPVNDHALHALKEQGLTIDHHSKQISESVLDWSDLILTMTTGHRDTLTSQYPAYQSKCFTLKEYVLDSPENEDIPDPFGQDITMYQETLNELTEYITLLGEKVINK